MLTKNKYIHFSENIDTVIDDHGLQSSIHDIRSAQTVSHWQFD